MPALERNPGRLPFREIWTLDFEFNGESGDRPHPVCLVAHELRSGRTLELWEDQLKNLDTPPFDVGPESLFVAYFASAEWGCFLALDWRLPTFVLDLYLEFRARLNGKRIEIDGEAIKRSLLDCRLFHGLDSILAKDKHDMRNRILRGGPWSLRDVQDILHYCGTDVTALDRLLPRMLPHILDVNPEIGLKRALLRGRFTKATAQMEHNGVPLDRSTWELLVERWETLRLALIREIDADYGVFEGQSFRRQLFERYLVRTNTPWPRLANKSTVLDLSKDTFRDMAKRHRHIAPLYELRTSLGELRLNALAVGADGRNRTLLSPFASKTGRNQPSNAKFIFGPATWIRCLISPPEGYIFTYIDYSAQEIGIAAALSQDPNLIEAYESGEPYISFDITAGGLPEDATKCTHEQEREPFKQTLLGTNYGMGAAALAGRIGIPQIYAKELSKKHREIYPIFWAWSDAMVHHAAVHGCIRSVFGWPVYVDKFSEFNSRSFRNFPMQANGAEMLRLACCFAAEDGLEIVAPVHDAIAMVAPAQEAEDHIRRLKQHMAEASRVVLGGFEIRTDPAEKLLKTMVRHGERYFDKRGLKMWNTVQNLLKTTHGGGSPRSG